MKEIDIPWTLVTIENHTFIRISTADSQNVIKAIDQRINEVTGILELARLIDLEEVFIRNLQSQLDWLKRRRKAVL